MNIVARTLVVGIAAAGASLGLASPASAEPPSGAYNGILIDGAGVVLNSNPIALQFAPCGPDCTTLTAPSNTVNLMLQGPTWVGGYAWGATQCTITVDAALTVLDDVCPGEQPMRMSLSRV